MAAMMSLGDGAGDQSGTAALAADPFVGNRVLILFERVDVYVPETDGVVSFEVDYR